MSRFLLRWLLAALCTFAASSAAAQRQGDAHAADPLDAKTSVPRLIYRSSLAAHRRLDDDKPLSWREANDIVGRIGGLRANLREASRPDAAPSAPPGAERSPRKP